MDHIIWFIFNAPFENGNKLMKIVIIILAILMIVMLTLAYLKGLYSPGHKDRPEEHIGIPPGTNTTAS